MTFQHDADGVPPEGTQSDPESTTASDAEGEPPTDTPPDTSTQRTPAQHGRAILALVAGGTLAVAPIANTVFGLAGGGYSSHSSPAYLLAEASHDIGHNDWAFQGGLGGRVIWAVTYVALALAWLAAALWIRMSERPRPTKTWFRVLGAVLATEFAAGAMTIGAGLYAQWTATSFGPVALRLADACSPWWACVAALIVVGRRERNTVALRAGLAYGVVLTLLLLVPLPGPNLVKVLVLAATAAVPAVFSPSALPRLSVAAASG